MVGSLAAGEVLRHLDIVSLFSFGFRLFLLGVLKFLLTCHSRGIRLRSQGVSLGDSGVRESITNCIVVGGSDAQAWNTEADQAIVTDIRAEGWSPGKVKPEAFILDKSQLTLTGLPKPWSIEVKGETASMPASRSNRSRCSCCSWSMICCVCSR